MSNQTTASFSPLIRRHFQFGWLSLLCFLSVGILLEAFWAFRTPWYIEPAYSIRRLVWTLGHAHGTLLALVHIAFAATLYILPNAPICKIVSPMLMAASVLLPGGFFLGGFYIYDGDPGMGIYLVPVGATCLFLSVLLTALGVMAKDGEATRRDGKMEST